jgi:hypothetical protein
MDILASRQQTVENDAATSTDALFFQTVPIQDAGSVGVFTKNVRRPQC